MDRAAAAVPSAGDIDPAGWQDEFDDMFAGVLAPAFVRREPRLRARWYVLGLASGLERKNGCTLAEFAGEATPDGMQRLLNAAVWDEDSSREATWPSANAARRADLHHRHRGAAGLARSRAGPVRRGLPGWPRRSGRTRLRPRGSITTALAAGLPLRDVQEAASHADPRTTMRDTTAPASPSTGTPPASSPPTQPAAPPRSYS
jgi:hypothetical protein